MLIGYAYSHSPGADPFLHYLPLADKSLNITQALDSPIIPLPFPIPDPSNPNPGTSGGVDFQDPVNFQNTVNYNPETGTYEFDYSVGGSFKYRPSSNMTLEEYMKYDMEQALQKNWQDASNDRSADNSSKSPIPTLKVPDGLGELFGSNFIDIKPSGTAELRFGVNSSRTDNPQIPERQRKITVFDFDQRIQLNVVGTVGTKLKLGVSYNTEATFDFENQMKLEYKGNEDEIIQSIEAGNVNLPLNSSLITGSQSLFGIKTQLKFGRLTATTVFSQQKGKRTEMEIAGGAQISTFEITADNYEANKHYFIGHYFRNQYDNAMASLPVINSQVNITRIEVWVTNTNNTVDNTRNIIAFSDLGENSILEGTPGNLSSNALPDNAANGLYNFVANNPGVRGFNNATPTLNSVVTAPGPLQQAVHYEKVQSARKLTEQEYNYNALLGFITLNQPLNNDEVLAVAFQYTYQGQTYQVGEFATDGIAGQDALMLKLLKGTITNPQFKRWDLMMKNVYALGAYQVNRENFRLDVWYNNPATSVDINFIPQPGVDDKPLVQILNLDRYDPNNNPFPDGVFDFIPVVFMGNRSATGGTINPQNGRVFFTTVEPFGSHLRTKLNQAGVDPTVINSIVYQPLYDSTKTAAQQIPQLNRFKIKGSYQSSSSSEISLNALNIPQGAVTVTAGGRTLVENQDYTVDYNLGRVRIINQGLLESQTPIRVSVESNTLFSMLTKTMIGTRFDYRVNKDIMLGGTIMNLTERPLTQKINIGDEPVSNTMIGLDGSFSKEVPLLTRLVDKIPLISTKEPSRVTASGEYARIIPGTARAINGISYIDDFEGSQSAIDIRAFNSWFLASVPKGQPNLFPEAELNNDLRYGMNRALLNWHVVDPLFYNNNNLTPGHIRNSAMQSNHTMRQVFEQEVFRNRQLAQGQPTNIAMFDLVYFPNERGPYNYDMAGAPGISAGLNSTGNLNDPTSRWAGIMRQLQTTDFEAANIESIRFWVMDPFNEDAINDFGTTGGDLYFNLGNISEDILADSRRSFENGLPLSMPYDPALVDTTAWGIVATTQPIVNAFENSNDPAIRLMQDVGLDGLNSANERTFFDAYVNWVNGSSLDPAAKAAILADVSNDDYNYYRDDRYDAQQLNIIQRYKRYNGTEGNSPTNEYSQTLNSDGFPTGATNLPNVEDINQDNNLSESESYFQYRVSMRPQDMVVGQNFITDVLTRTIDMPNGTTRTITWYQFTIPVRNYERAVNGISDFRSIRFIRMFMKGWSNPATLRFARLEMIRGEWRTYIPSLLEDGEYIQGDPASTNFSVFAVNIEENGNRVPTPYVLPPGINRQIDVSTANLRNLNEQSLAMKVCALEDGDARACYRNVAFDVRSYKRLKMFVHAETASETDRVTYDSDVTLFLRLGTDFTDNYYEYELPLKMTPWYSSTDNEIWRSDNEIDLAFETLTELKMERNSRVLAGVAQNNRIYVKTDPDNPDRRIKVIGNPNLQGLKVIMVGVRNPGKNSDHPWKPDDGLSKCLEVWINELRLTDFDQQGGWAALGRVNANLADFANVSLSGNYSTPYWGSMEKRVSERQRDTRYGFDGSSSFELGKFFPEKWNLRIPLFLGYSENVIKPQFDPLNPDIEFNRLSPSERAELGKKVIDYTRRRSMNFTNVRKDRGPNSGPARFWNIENFSATYAYSEMYHRDINVEYNINKTYRAGLNYNFNTSPKSWEPFRNSKLLAKSKYFNLIKDFNLFLGPKTIAIRNDINRTYSANQIRNNFDALVFPTYTKNFTWVRSYDVKYDISKNLKFDFNANNNALIGEPPGRVDRDYREEYQVFKDSVMHNFRNFGINRQYNHTANVNYTWPINKIPLLDWITITTRYSAGYEWQRAAFGQDSLGNIIQNSRNVNWSGQFNFTILYNKVPFLKKVNQKAMAGGVQTRQPQQQPKPQTNATDSTKTEKPKREPIFTVWETLARVGMSLKTVTLNYSTTDGILLPGYNQTNQFFGMDNSWESPGVGFVLGRQNRDLLGRPNTWGQYNDYAFYAAGNGWLVENPLINTQYTSNHAQNFSARVSLEPLTGLRIDLTADRNLSENYTSFFRWVDTLNGSPYLDYAAQNPMTNGMLSMSVISWRTAFIADRENNISPVFENFRANRTEISALLGDENPNSSGMSGSEEGYRDGYGGTQQDVMIASFLSAYTGKGPRSGQLDLFGMLPLPNWRVTFDPMAKTKLQFLRKRFKSLSISHGYRSTMTLANYTTNLLGSTDPAGNLNSRDISDNFINTRQINQVVISEQFSPLINVDITWNIKSKNKTSGLITKVELKRDRNMALSLTNNQLTEVRGRELVLGTGYRFNQVKLPIKIAGKDLESDLNCRVDVSIRNNTTYTRKVVENQNQATAGQQIISIKSSADYSINSKLTVRFYFDRVLNRPVVSTSFPTANTNTGIAIRFTL